MLSGLTHWIEQRPALHRVALRLWRLFPPRLAGLLKRFMARDWIVGAVGVLVDTSRSPSEVLLIEHSYRRRGAWGLPGGSLESMPQRPREATDAGLPDDVLERYDIYSPHARLLRIDLPRLRPDLAV